MLARIFIFAKGFDRAAVQSFVPVGGEDNPKQLGPGAPGNEALSEIGRSREKKKVVTGKSRRENGLSLLTAADIRADNGKPADCPLRCPFD